MSKTIIVTLPDGSQKNYEVPVTPMKIAEDISRGLAKKALLAEVDDQLVDLNHPLTQDSAVQIITMDDPRALEVLRHSTAHIMAQAVKNLFPGTKLAIGPSIADGFYYDFDVEKPFTPAQLEQIVTEMARISKEDLTFERVEVSREQAINFFKEKGEDYKVELIEDLPEGSPITMYKQGEFVDLCLGPHIPSTKYAKAYKLMSVAGAYWRGSEKNKMLQRIYGTAFPQKKDLDEHLHRLEEAAKRDHRKIGKELDLFSIQEEGPGFPFFHPKGMVLRNELENFWRQEHVKRGYQEIRTPIILSQELWQQSGHWDHYQENMYFTNIDEHGYAIKPMNCPGSILVYRRKLHSYRDLPVRVGELGLVHRHELSGVLHGLMRVRCFTQDDAHIFMLPEQIKEEILGVIELIDYFYKTFGFEYHVELSTKPEKAMGSDEIWERATSALEEALQEKGMNYKINEGDGAFYGPKIDFHLKDCIGRTWQCGTIQLDFQMPEKFDLNYIGQDGEKHRPVMIHRVVFGSIERFIGILTEHYAGAFPLWLSPVQVRILPVTDKVKGYAEQLKDDLSRAGIRVELDGRNEKIGYKIREAQLDKVPYMVVIGEKEENTGSVAVRSRHQGDLGSQSFEQFKHSIIEEIENKSSQQTVC